LEKYGTLGKIHLVIHLEKFSTLDKYGTLGKMQHT